MGRLTPHVSKRHHTALGRDTKGRCALRRTRGLGYERLVATLLVGGELCFATGPPDALADAPPERHASETEGAIPVGAGPVIGERLAFQGRWLGIPVGYGWIEVKGVVKLDGQEAIHIEAQGHTNQVFSTLYPIHDIIHCYLDPRTFQPIRFDKDQREGHYRAHEIVTFDRHRRMATYRSLVNQSEKEIPLPDEFQDLIGAFYWLRRQPIHPGRSVVVDLYTDEKIYHTTLQISQPLWLELLKRGTFFCVIVEPQAFFKGLLVRRGRLWAYLTADAYRIPLLIKATTPWGPMSAVLDETSIPNTVRRLHNAGGDSAGP